MITLPGDPRLGQPDESSLDSRSPRKVRTAGSSVTIRSASSPPSHRQSDTITDPDRRATTRQVPPASCPAAEPGQVGRAAGHRSTRSRCMPCILPRMLERWPETRWGMLS